MVTENGPVEDINVGDDSTPAVADLNGDGMLDLVVGAGDGMLHYFENTGTATAPKFEKKTGGANPFAGIDIGERIKPAFADMDGDGLLDLIVGIVGTNAKLSYYRNVGSAAVPSFDPQSGDDNLFKIVIQYYEAGGAPLLVNLDGDDDWDLVLASDSALLYFENVGNGTVPKFDESFEMGTQEIIPLKVVGVPVLSDVDADGDLDLIVEEDGGKIPKLSYFENVGSAEAFDFKRMDDNENPFSVVTTSGNSAPAFADLDGDGEHHGVRRKNSHDLFRFYLIGDLDLVLGGSDGALVYFEQVGPQKAHRFVDRSDVVPLADIDIEEVAPATGDLDGDGDLDLIVGGYLCRNIASMAWGSTRRRDAKARRSLISTQAGVVALWITI